MSTAVCSINAAKFFAESLRSEINKYIYQPLEETSPWYSTVKTLCEEFLKKSDLEKFYRSFFAAVPLNSTQTLGQIIMSAKDFCMALLS